MKHISEILRDVLYPTPEQLESQCKTEQAYRRGYQHGYNEAMDTVFGLLRAGEEVASIIRLASAHDRRIATWREDHDFTMLPPPAFRRLYVADTHEEEDPR